MRDKHTKTGGSRKTRESKGAGVPTQNMAYDYRAPSNELFPTSVQANIRLPTGRPFLTDSRESVTDGSPFTDNRNKDVPAVQRPRIYMSLNDAAYNEGSPVIEWLDYAVQQMYTGLRVSNRSNVGYGVSDLKDYLVQVIALYAYARAATTHMMCYNMSDPRVPALQTLLCAGFDNAITVDDGYAYIARADDTSYLPVWMRNIQESWSRAKLAADQLATLPIPARFKQYIDYMFGNVFVDESVGGQYYKLDLAVTNTFPWISDAVLEKLGLYYAEGTTSDNLWKVIAQIATGLSGPSATLNTMVSDLRRLEGMVPCVIDIPSDFSTLPPLVVNDELFFDTLDNACWLNFPAITQEALNFPKGGNYNGEANAGVAGQTWTIEMGEVRVDATHSLDDPARLAMITSLMGVSNSLEGGFLGSFVTPFIYCGTLYGHMQWVNNEYLAASFNGYGIYRVLTPLHSLISSGQPQITFTGAFSNHYGYLMNTSVLYETPRLLEALRFGTMEHHPQYPVYQVPITAYSNEVFGVINNYPKSFEIIKVVKEGTRVSIPALKDIQFYAWASLLRL